MIRLNKVTKDLNVGVKTIVEFLQKKGYADVDDNPNAKITDEQYAELVKEFSSDKNLRLESEKFSQERQNRERNKETVQIEGFNEPSVEKEKPKAEKPKETIMKVEFPEDRIPQIKSVGKIDLDSLNRKFKPKEQFTAEEAKPEEKNIHPEPVAEVTVSEEKTEKEPVKPVESGKSTTFTEEKGTTENIEIIKEDVKAESAEVKPIVEKKLEKKPVEEKPVEEKLIEEKPKKAEAEPAKIIVPQKPVEKKIEQTEKVKVENTKVEAPEKEQVQEEKIFRIHQNQPIQKINVLGKIDLDALNQSTRPKKKSKEEKKKEREDKEKQRVEIRKQMRDAIMKEIKVTTDNNGNNNGQKKHRNRINKVDVKAELDAENRSQKKNTNGNGNKPVGAHSANTGNNNGKGFNNNTRGQKNANGQNNGNNGQQGGGKKNRDRYKKQAFRPEVKDEDVAKQVKETLARLTNKSHSKTSKYRKEKRESAFNRQQEAEQQEEKQSKILKLTEFVTVNELASMMDVPVTQIIGTCMSIGMMVSINQRLDAETINLVAEEFGFKTEYVSADVVEAVTEEEDKAEDLQSRAPIVTVMGHVDHGKTSLLDYIRKANVIAGEAGGITQHIGAYNVKLEDGRHITFLDTPGHEAFTAMRARGAKVTDIAIIIVAADDNVMPQTKEAINHAMAAGVPIVFAINKIDKPGANPDKIKEELAGMNFLVEEWGGKYQSQDISAKKGVGVHELLEKVLLEAELLDLKANPDRKAAGSIIESSLDKGRGYVATILVSNGTLKVGDIVLAGTHYGRVKAMFNERNQRIEKAGPSEPALILGLNGAPAAGDNFYVIETDQEARDIANKREQLQREQGLRTHKMLTLDEVGRRIALGNFQELNVIVKGDVDGSIEALSDSLIKLSTQQIQVNVIHKAVGQISESDVSLAAASQAIIIGFQVRPSLAARKLADQEGVDIRTYSIIYDAIEEVKAAMIGMLQPVVKEEVTATLEVRDVFHISKVGTVAGAIVKEGKVKRSDKARVVRDGIVVFTGEINALKRFKDDVKEVAVNFECGISLVNYNDIKSGDVIETFQEVEVKQSL